MANKKTLFNPDWTDKDIYPEWSIWVASVKESPYRAKCTVCKTSFELSNMGKQALTSHENGAKHRKNMKSMTCSLPVSNFLKSKEEKSVDTEQTIAKENTTVSSTPAEKVIPCNSGQSRMDNFVSKESTLKAEILWAMKLVVSHHSYHSSKDMSHILQLMFPDSKIAKSISLSPSKISYIISFGLSEYFSQALKSDIGDSKLVVCFDEAMNKIAQKEQMDIILRYWSKTSNLVSTRYFNSMFLGHATAEDLMENFKEGTLDLSLNKLIQISMDGPNVNIKMARMLNEHLQSEFSCELLDLGTCGLHTINGAFQTGHRSAGWTLHTVFRALYQLFKDSPARRADYTSLTESTLFPLKHCEVRWLENNSVADRAIEVFENVKKYVKQSKLPKTYSVETLENAFENKMILPQMAFFSTISSLLQSFLKKFQSSEPLAPFLYTDTFNIVHQLMKKFVKAEVLKAATTPEKCLKIDFSEKSKLRGATTVDIGIAASRLVAKSNATEAEKRAFRLECIQFLKRMTEKILERSPLNFPFVRYLSSLDPKLLHSNSVLCEKRMDKLLQILYEKKVVTSHTADSAKQQYSTLCHKAKAEFEMEFKNYSYKESRLDIFYRDLLSKDDDFKDLWEVIKISLILSNGNASVESGFSINKDILVENLAEKSLIALRTVYDAIKAYGGIENIEITKEMMTYVKMARTRYHNYLDEQKKIKKEEDDKKLNKRAIASQVKILRKKKMKLSQEIENETRNIDNQLADLLKRS